MSNVNLSWPANPASELIAAYNVYRSLNGVDFSLHASTANSTPSYSDTVTSPGVYHYRVAAVNLAGEGPQSNTASTPSLPTQPGDITVVVS